MSQTIVVKSFADLPRLLNLDELPPDPAYIPTSPPMLRMGLRSI
jgi:hypothetical protein